MSEGLISGPVERKRGNVMRNTILLCVLVAGLYCGVASSQLKFPDNTVQTTSADFRHVVKIDSIGDTTGNQTTNGTTLIAAMTAISGVNTVPTLILLGSGTYDIGASVLTMKPEVTVRGTLDTKVTGTGPATVTSAVDCGLEEIEIANRTEGSTVLDVTGGEIEVRFSDIVYEGGDSHPASICVSVRSGGSAELAGTEITFESSGAGAGGVIGIEVRGEGAEGSRVEMEDCHISLVDSDEAMTLFGAAVGNGTAVNFTPKLEMRGGTINVRSNDGLTTGVSIAADGAFESIAASVRTESSSGDFLGTNALNNAGAVQSFATVFQGARIDTGGAFQYAQCAEYGGSGLRPITNTLTAEP